MTAKKTLINVAKIQDTLAKIQVLIEGNNSNAKWRQGFSMHPNEASNKLEQEFYDKARGCSVKAQEDNIFDYQDFLK
ncbi:hypothetical protein [Flavobacterium sp.]|uniref:hypothetical protein n=1 Tax=Flavobacterium sp. TaxID=239 RepID=UPI00286B9ECE|nr:hypothetical protein [Flavobacterium sp.]